MFYQKTRLDLVLAFMVLTSLLLSSMSVAQISDDISPYCSYLDEPAPGGGSKPTDLSLCTAMMSAVKANPDLEALKIKIEALEARTAQASLRPNPSLEASLENFAGSGGYRRLDQAEETFQLSLPIELGDKREHRREVALSEKDFAGIEYEIKRAEIIQGVTVAFVEILTSQEKLALSERRKATAREFVATARRRVAAGKSSSVEEIKAKIALSNSELGFDQAKRELATARSKLAFYFTQSPEPKMPYGNIDSFLPPPTWEALEKASLQSLELRRIRLEANKRKTIVALEESKALSDLTVSGGVRIFQDTKDAAYLVGVSVPLPIFDRNQGAISEALKNLAASNFEEQAEILKSVTSLKEAYQEMMGAYDRATKLRIDVLPNAEQGLAVSNNAYWQGKLNYLDVLDAERTLFDAREDYINALATYHTARAMAERLLGQSFRQLTNAK